MEDRIVTCRIAGREFPMCLTMRATKAITKRFGGVSELADNLRGMSLEDQLGAVLWLLALLLREGCALDAYLRDRPQEIPPDEETLELLITPGDLVQLRQTIFHCMAVGLGREVPTEDDRKNPEAGPETTASSPG